MLQTNIVRIRVAYARWRERSTGSGGGRHDRGATAVEYGLIVGLIAIVIIVAVALFGRNLSGSFDRSASTIASVAGV